MTPPLCPNGHGPMVYRGSETYFLVDHVFSPLSEGTKAGRYATWRCARCSEIVQLAIEESQSMPTVCDFCSALDPITKYPCADFTVVPLRKLEDGTLDTLPGSPPGGHQAQDYTGEWFACAACARFIDANDQPGLTRRAIEVRQPASEEANRMMLQFVTVLHKAFFSHRILERR